ncbi:hypothetical protein [Mycobacterium tilburgii]|uniref:hypothetical protein n=1 Tax=Mycobacterium tilburgii TaxID=44467 RepID=UPI0021B356A7|nr:hypothetical protein [Mycobacterium tilburgii]
MCAGAIGSPRLLQLSGIGPAGHLCGGTASAWSSTCQASGRTCATTRSPRWCTRRPSQCWRGVQPRRCAGGAAGNARCDDAGHVSAVRRHSAAAAGNVGAGARLFDRVRCATPA